MDLVEILNIRKNLLYTEIEITDLQIQKFEQEKVQDFLQARFIQEQIDRRIPWKKAKLDELQVLLNDKHKLWTKENIGNALTLFQTHFQFLNHDKESKKFLNELVEKLEQRIEDLTHIKDLEKAEELREVKYVLQNQIAELEKKN